MNDAELIRAARDRLSSYQGRPLRIMEVCGTHTHEIFRQGIRLILSDNIRLISGPGCPVCVTPVSYIDAAIYLALEKEVIITTFGDLIRVPGTKLSLRGARQNGADVRMVYSPLDALRIARENPAREVVFLSVGFETTVPAECIALQKAEEEQIPNFSLLVANKTMPMAYRALKGSADAFLYPGHVCAITGTGECKKLVEEGFSGVVAGFTLIELLTALLAIVKGCQKDTPFFLNCYPRVVQDEGNPRALAMISQTMDACDTEWRGLGTIPGSGLRLKKQYANRDAFLRFAIPALESHANKACRCGEILQGKCLPKDCKVFGKGCTPEHPIGACMVSSEGTCAAYYQYGGDVHGH